jgi:hypothetical protein
MGPWASVIVAVAGLNATFLAVMAFRGLIDALDGITARCGECGKTTMLPLPVGAHQCWQCRHSTALVPRLGARNGPRRAPDRA